MYLCFTSLWYLLDYCTCNFALPVWYLSDYCTCTFASPVYEIFLIIFHVPLPHQFDIFLVIVLLTASPFYDIFLVIVHLPLLHQFIISSWLLYMCLCFTSLWYLPDYCTFTFASLHQSMISSWLLYMWLCFPSLWYITIIIHVPLLSFSPDYFTCTFAVPVYIYIYSSTETF